MFKFLIIAALFATTAFGQQKITEKKSAQQNAAAWFIEANIGGPVVDLSLTNVASYTEITAGSLDLVNNTTKGSDSSAQIPCSGTNPPTGLTCSAGNESIGISFIPPHVGHYVVCAYFSWYTSMTDNDRVATNFQLIETPTNAQTLTQEGGARAVGAIYGQRSSGSAEQNIPIHTCGIFKFTSVARKVVRLMYEVQVVGTIEDHEITLDRAAVQGQRDLLITVRPL